MTRTLTLSVVVGLLVVVAPSQDRKIRRSELPAAVEKTVAAQSQGATIRGFFHRKGKWADLLRSGNDRQPAPQRHPDR